MNSSAHNNLKDSDQWSRYCELLFYDEEIGLWLDISRMAITVDEISCLEQPFKKAFSSIQELEEGAIANKDEERQVGHYWLRNPSIAPSRTISNEIQNEINEIKKFGKAILSGNIKTSNALKFTHVLWIGIGGSALGPLLLINSLKRSNQGLDFSFIDNVDPNGIYETLNSIKANLASTLFVVVSKSGGTPEPQIAMDQTREFLKKSNINWSERAIAITMKDSSLFQKAEAEKWLKVFNLPSWVGGRTSITGAVGLLPLALIGSDIDLFLQGASTMDSVTRNNDIYKNPSALLASVWFYSGNGKGLRDMVVLPYQDRLEVFSKYLQQLIMESLGKQLDRNGNKVNQGISVYGNKGSTDQHAYVQQLRDGIDNFFVTFIEILEDNKNVPKINKKAPGDYLSGFLQGTRLALSENNRQSTTITLKQFNPYTLGVLIALFERTVSLYAELININAYNQPGVESGKKAASNILTLQSNIESLIDNNDELTIQTISSLLPESSSESIFIILRHLVTNNCKYSISGDWSHPKSLIIKKAVS